MSSEAGPAGEAARRRAVPSVLVAIGAAAWIVAIAAEASGRASLLHHDTLIEGTLPLAIALALFAVAWQSMIAAMMLPSALPMVSLYSRAAGSGERPVVASAAFVSGYAA